MTRLYIPWRARRWAHRARRRTGEAVTAASLIAVGAGAALALTPTDPPPTACQPGPVTRVVDADTIDVGACRVRLLGVDAPETQWRRRGTPWCADYALGAEAARAVESLTLGRPVTFGRTEADSSGRDMAAEVYLPDGTELGAWLVQAGLAVTWPAPSPADACPPGAGPGMEPNR